MKILPEHSENVYRATDGRALLSEEANCRKIDGQH